MWTDVISDDCQGCKSVNYSDHGGWSSRSINPSCPVHGPAADRKEAEAQA